MHIGYVQAPINYKLRLYLKQELDIVWHRGL